MTEKGQRLHQFVLEGNIQRLMALLEENDTNSDDLRSLDEDQQSIMDVAVAQNHVLVVEALIAALKEKDAALLSFFLLHHPRQQHKNLPVMIAAGYADPGIYNTLIKLPVGYDDTDLSKIEAERRNALAYERRWGFWGALLKSACPSKAISDAATIPVFVGGALIATTLALFAVTIVFASLALVGLGIMTYANYKKHLIEQNVEDETLRLSLLSAQISNFDVHLKQLKTRCGQWDQKTPDEQQQLREEIRSLSDKLTALRKARKQFFADYDFGETGKNKQERGQFLTTEDEWLLSLSIIGEIMCTTTAVITLAGMALALAGASMGVSLAVFVVLAVGVSVWYAFNRSAQVREISEQRQKQYDSRKSLHKQFLNLEHSDSLAMAHDLMCEYDPEGYQHDITSEDYEQRFARDKHRYLAKSAQTMDEPGYSELWNAVNEGDVRLFKRCIVLGASITPPESTPAISLLHIAAQQGNALILEEMLGTSVAAIMRRQRKALAYSGDESEVFDAIEQNRQLKNEHYQQLVRDSKNLLLLRDEQGLLPLHHAAALSDTTSFKLLLKQTPGYSQADIDKACEIRNARMQREKIQTFVHAIVESLCPTSALSEIGGSLLFAGLIVTGGLGLGITVGIASVGLFALVVYGNYFKGKLERGLIEDLDRVNAASARVRNIQPRLEQLNQRSHNLTAEERQELTAIRHLLDNAIPPASWGTKTRAADFITTADKRRVLASSAGAFLCSFSGVLGLVGLVFVLAGSGPIGWVGLAMGALVGLLIANYYYQQRHEELRSFGEQRQAIYTREQALASSLDNLKSNDQTMDLLQRLETDIPDMNPALTHLLTTGSTSEATTAVEHAVYTKPRPSPFASEVSELNYTF